MTAHIANAIASAVSKGFSARTIVQYLLHNFPQYSNRINQALAMGYTADRILKHLTEGGRSSNPDNTNAYLTESEKTDKIDRERKRKERINAGLAAAGLAAGLGALGAMGARGANAIGSSSIIPSPSGPIPPTPSPQTMPPAQQLGLPNAQQMTPQISPAPQPGPIPSPMQAQAPKPTSIPTPSPTQQPTIPSSQLLQSMGQLDRVKNLINAGNPPETIATAINTFLKGDDRKKFGDMLKSGQAKPLIDMIKDVQQEMTQLPETPSQPSGPGPVPGPQSPQGAQALPIVPQEAIAPPMQAQPMPEPVQQPEPIVPPEKEITKEPEQPKPIAKKELVLTPDGVGEVKAISGDHAIVDVDGKAKKVPLDELIQSPMPEKDLADLYDDLKTGIEKATDEDMSRMVDYAAYNAEKNQLAFLPHIGSLYIYDNISPDDATLLRNVLNVRKTSGGNWIGDWKKGSSSPIGAAMSALIQKLQKERGGKGNEYSGKFDTVYKAFEPAIKASKEKKAAKEKAEKESLKPKKPPKPTKPKKPK